MQINGKDVDCLAFAMESGGITVLVDILTNFNLIDLFPRVVGIQIPVLVAIGHQSQLDLVFLLHQKLTPLMGGVLWSTLHNNNLASWGCVRI